MRWKIANNIYRAALILLICLGISGCSRKPDTVVSGFLPETDGTEMHSGKTAGETARSAEAEALALPDNLGETEAVIQVFVCGAVEYPGVYRLAESARVYEAVEAAGGFGPEADQDWLNLAQTLQDGEKLRVYTVEETQELHTQGLEEQGGELSRETSGSDGKINLNTATREQLMTLPGIGEAKADAVITYREEQGKFQSIEEIMNISGIKEAVFFKIKDMLMV